MIEYIEGDITEAPPGSVIIHACNCQGKMNAGVAKAIREKFPSAYDAYMRDFYTENLVLGRISAVEIPLASVLVVNAYTQFYYGRDGGRYTNYEAVAVALSKSVMFVQEYDLGWEVSSFAFPRLGCSLGGGNWEVVSAIIDTTIPDEYRKVCYDLRVETKT